MIRTHTFTAEDSDVRADGGEESEESPVATRSPHLTVCVGENN